jgi:selenocysteine-specific elongation factor
MNDQIVGYKFDIDAEEKMCRIAFHGKVRHIITADPNTAVKLYKEKYKTGVVDRLVDNYTLIVKDLFDKSFLDIKEFVGKDVTIEGYPNQKGKIDGSFGKSGKVRVIFKNIIEVPDIEGKNVLMKYTKWYH